MREPSKKFIIGLVLGVIIFSIVTPILFWPKEAQAFDIWAAVAWPLRWIWQQGLRFWDIMKEQTSAIFFKNVLNTFLQQAASQSAAFIMGGSEEAGPLFVKDKDFWNNLANSTAAGFLDQVAKDFTGQGLCEPIDPTIKLNILLSLPVPKPPAPFVPEERCSLEDIKANLTEASKKSIFQFSAKIEPGGEHFKFSSQLETMIDLGKFTPSVSASFEELQKIGKEIVELIKSYTETSRSLFEPTGAPSSVDQTRIEKIKKDLKNLESQINEKIKKFEDKSNEIERHIKECSRLAGYDFCSKVDCLKFCTRVDRNYCLNSVDVCLTNVRFTKDWLKKIKAQYQSVTLDWQRMKEDVIKAVMVTVGEQPGQKLKDFQKILSPEGNPLGQIGILSESIAEKVSREVEASKFMQSLKGEWKAVEEKISGEPKLPAGMTEEQAREAIKSGTASAKVYTGVMIADAINLFTQTLLSKFIDNLLKGKISFLGKNLLSFPTTVSWQSKTWEELFGKAGQPLPVGGFRPLGGGDGGIGGGDGGRGDRVTRVESPITLPKEEEMEAIFADVLSTPLKKGEAIRLIDDLSQCPSDPRYALPNNCVVDTTFARAVEQELTIEEAMAKNYLHPEWAVSAENSHKATQASGTGGGTTGIDTKRDFSSRYSYTNIKILAQAGIVPLGLQIAAEKISRGSDPKLTAERYTLKEIVEGFDKTGKDGKCGTDDDESPFCGLVNPRWRLKDFPRLCQMMGYSAIPLPSSPERQEVCLQSQDCTQENDDGTCNTWNYCTAYRNSWRFGADRCEPQYNSCQAYTRTKDGAKFNWLEKTLDYNDCDASNIGCQWYCKNYEPSLGEAGMWSCSGPGKEYRQYQYPGGTCTTPGGCRGGPCTVSEGSQYCFYETLVSENTIFFNRQVETCQVTAEGCSQFIRTKDNLGTNLIPNPGFENYIGTEPNVISLGWSFSSDPPGTEETVFHGKFTFDEARAYGGKVFAQFTKTGSLYPVGVNIILLPETKYTLSLFVKNENVNDRNLTFQIPGTSVYKVWPVLGNSTWQQLTYNFTTAKDFDKKITDLKFLSNGADLSLDNLQLEAGSQSTYKEYGASNLSYLRKAPKYLNCYNRNPIDGKLDATDDSPDCLNFIKACEKDEVGCEKYTPVLGGPYLPAIAKWKDLCPRECVGYDNFREIQTNFYPNRVVSFIPKTTRVCPASEVGCEGFTNIEEVARGGEARVFYSYLRACQKPDSNCAYFYTWIGSDTRGYELKRYYLRKNEANEPFEIFNQTTAEGLWGQCQGPEDARINSNCKEFYNEDGAISYKLYQNTIVCREGCLRLRKNKPISSSYCWPALFEDGNPVANQPKIPGLSFSQVGGEICEVELGQRTCLTPKGEICDLGKNCTSNKCSCYTGTCIFTPDPSESVRCSAVNEGCREYKGNSANNIRTAFFDDFEQGTVLPWQGISGTKLSYSNESVYFGGHSLGVGKMEITPPTRCNCDQLDFIRCERENVGETATTKSTTGLWQINCQPPDPNICLLHGQIIRVPNDPNCGGAPGCSCRPFELQEQCGGENQQWVRWVSICTPKPLCSDIEISECNPSCTNACCCGEWQDVGCVGNDWKQIRTCQPANCTPNDGEGYTKWIYNNPRCTMAPVPLTLTVKVNGNGIVKSVPSGINCGPTGGPDCTEPYVKGTVVTLTAYDSTGAVKTPVTWSGCDNTSSDATICTVTMDNSKTVTADFNITPQTATLNVSVIGDGYVVSTLPNTDTAVAGIDCGPKGSGHDKCSATYLLGTEVILVSVGDVTDLVNFKVPVKWSGDCESTSPNTCFVVMDANPKNVTADFTAISGPYVTLRVFVEDEGVVRADSPINFTDVSWTWGGIDCGSGRYDCEEKYPKRDPAIQVTLTAYDKTGAIPVEAEWSGACEGISETCRVLMNNDKNVNAKFGGVGLQKFKPIAFLQKIFSPVLKIFKPKKIEAAIIPTPGPVGVERPIDGLVPPNRAYLLTFLIKGTLSPQKISAQFSPSNLSFGEAAITQEWQTIRLGPVYLTSPDEKLLQIISQQGPFFIDNIELRETGSIYAIKNSWFTPVSCDNDYDDPEGLSCLDKAYYPRCRPQAMIGCAEYRDRDNKSNFLKGFSKLCPEDRIGCEVLINTQNSYSPFQEQFNNDQAPLTDDVTVPADENEYLVYDKNFTCSVADKGCQKFGLPDLVDDKPTTWSDVFLKNNPDLYKMRPILCRQTQVNCEEFTTSVGGTVYLKDPGEKQCQWRDKVLIGAETKTGWFKQGTDQSCYENYSPDGVSYGIRFRGDPQHEGYVGLCPDKAIGCKKFVDPLLTTEPNYLNNGDFEKRATDLTKGPAENWYSNQSVNADIRCDSSINYNCRREQEGTNNYLKIIQWNKLNPAPENPNGRRRVIYEVQQEIEVKGEPGVSYLLKFDGRITNLPTFHWAGAMVELAYRGIKLPDELNTCAERTNENWCQDWKEYTANCENENDCQNWAGTGKYSPRNCQFARGDLRACIASLIDAGAKPWEEGGGLNTWAWNYENGYLADASVNLDPSLSKIGLWQKMSLKIEAGGKLNPKALPLEKISVIAVLAPPRWEGGCDGNTTDECRNPWDPTKNANNNIPWKCCAAYGQVDFDNFELRPFDPFYLLDNYKLKKGDCTNVSLEEGCVLFYDETLGEPIYNSIATYQKSQKLRRAVPPIDCTKIPFTVSQSKSSFFAFLGKLLPFKVQAAITLPPTGCASPDYKDTDYCQYCYALGQNKNDTNLILKVDATRVCAEWLHCDKFNKIWVKDINDYIEVCENASRCTRQIGQGKEAQCVSRVTPSFEVLDEIAYKKRDTSWFGLEPAGYSLYNFRPVEKLVSKNYDITLYGDDIPNGSVSIPDQMMLTYLEGNIDKVDKGVSGSCPLLNEFCKERTLCKSEACPTGSFCYKDTTGGRCVIPLTPQAAPEKDAPFHPELAETFANVNVCTLGLSEQGFFWRYFACQGAYKKAEYGYVGGTKKYFNVQVTSADGVCVNARRPMKVGDFCDPDHNHQCGFVDCAAGQCSCERLTKETTYYGKSNFCLSQDNSRPTPEITKSCLLWYPLTYPLLPEVLTTGSSNVGYRKATLEGYLTSLGASSAVKVWFEYGTDQQAIASADCGSYTNRFPEINNEITKNSSQVGFSVEIGPTVDRPLNPGTTYYFRAVAKNLHGQVCGEIRRFDTLTPSIPTIKITTPPDVWPTRATLKARLVALNDDPPPRRIGFVYGDTANNLNQTAVITSPPNFSEGNFSAEISELVPDQDYYYKAFVENSKYRSEVPLLDAIRFHTPKQGYAYVSMPPYSLVIDISGPSIVNNEAPPSESTCISPDQDYIFTLESFVPVEKTIRKYSLSDPTNPMQIGEYDLDTLCPDREPGTNSYYYVNLLSCAVTNNKVVIVCSNTDPTKEDDTAEYEKIILCDTDLSSLNSCEIGITGNRNTGIRDFRDVAVANVNDTYYAYVTMGPSAGWSVLRFNVNDPSQQSMVWYGGSNNAASQMYGVTINEDKMKGYVSGFGYGGQPGVYGNYIYSFNLTDLNNYTITPQEVPSFSLVTGKDPNNPAGAPKYLFIYLFIEGSNGTIIRRYEIQDSGELGDYTTCSGVGNINACLLMGYNDQRGFCKSLAVTPDGQYIMALSNGQKIYRIKFNNGSNCEKIEVSSEGLLTSVCIRQK